MEIVEAVDVQQPGDETIDGLSASGQRRLGAVLASVDADMCERLEALTLNMLESAREWTNRAPRKPFYLKGLTDPPGVARLPSLGKI